MLKCRNDFVFFCEQVLDLEMSDFHKEIAHLLVTEKQICMNVPRQHGKTMICSIAYPLWRLAREKNVKICLVSSSLEQSGRIFSEAQYILQTNPFFAQLLPTRRFETWNKSQITMSNHNLYFVKPFNSSGRGTVFDYVIFDDILRETDVSPLVAKDIFWSVFYPAGQANNCQQIVIGTPLSLDDLYADIQRKTNWSLYKRSAAIEDSQGKWIGTLWPSRFPIDKLQQMKGDMNPYNFEREMMCRPRSAGDVLYPQELILNCIDYNLEFSSEVEGIPYVGADFAMSTKESGDFNVFVAVDDAVNTSYSRKTDAGEVTIENPVYIRKMIRFRGNVGQTDSILRLADTYKHGRIIADNSGVGAKFVKELRENQLSVDAQDFQPAKRNMLLMNLRTLIEKQRLVIPGGDECSPLVNILLRELSGFRSVKSPTTGHESWKSNLEHDDTVMALAMAVKSVSNPHQVMQDVIFGV